MICIGIDNGTNATMGIIDTEAGSDWTELMKVPVKVEQSFTKKAQRVSRLDHAKFKSVLEQFKFHQVDVLIEQPMVNKFLFNASLSAVRMYEAQIVILEQLGTRYKPIYSKDWQKEIFKGPRSKGDDTKLMSYEIGNALFPQFKDFKHTDRDGILIAEYLRRWNSNQLSA